MGGMDRAVGIRLRLQFDPSDRRAIDRRAHAKAALVQQGLWNAEFPHKVLDTGIAWRERGLAGCHGATRSARGIPGHLVWLAPSARVPAQRPSRSTRALKRGAYVPA